jgi:4-amino-4-deoxy-L-arabinose transferase-like glycosyltransferase
MKFAQRIGIGNEFERSSNYLVILFLAIHAFVLGWGASVQSPTLNEPGHLVAGISNLKFGRFDVYKVNPPLVRLIAATPVLLAGCETDWANFYDGPTARPEFALGEDFVKANGEKSLWLFTLARWSCIPFCLLGGYICFRWARELYGSLAGILGLVLWCFCPNILAHGQLITSDMAATSIGFAACYVFWRWLKKPTWRHTVLSGFVLGLAELSKTTLIIFYPLWPLIWAVYRWPDRRRMKRRDWLREIWMLFVRTVVCIYVVNLGYGFEGSCTRLGDFRFVSAGFGAEQGAVRAPAEGGNRFTNSWLAELPLPLPKNYVLGIDLQKRDFEDYSTPSYLRGAFQDKGWWYYYLYAMAIKVPLGTWFLLALAATCRFWWRGAAASPSLPCSNGKENKTEQVSFGKRQKTGWRDEFILLTPAVVILAFVSSQIGFSEHLRYVLPIFPFIFVWISRVAVVFNRRHWILASVAGTALAWSIASSLLVYPHSLSYFNELVGGPKGGPNHLIHSNVDWGQDLLFLKRWLNEHPEAKPLNLIYFGYFDPRHAGIEYSVPEELLSSKEAPIPLSKIPPGWYAISVNFVRGFPYFVYKGDATIGSLRRYALTEFQNLEPVAMAGYSIYIYHVKDQK